MAEEQVQTPAPSPEPQQQPQQQADLSPDVKAFQDETANFKPIGEVQAQWKAEDGAAEPAAAAEEPVAEEAKPAEGEENLEPPTEAKDVPDWLKRRTQRFDNAEARAAERERIAEERIREADERLAAAEVMARAAKLTEPDPDAFDTVDEYELAKTQFTEAQAAAGEAAKPKAAPAEKKPDAAASPHDVLGITQQDRSAAVQRITEAVPKTVAEKLADSGTVLPAAVMMEIADQPSKEATDAMARWVLGNQETVKVIAKLPPRQQAAALVRAFYEKASATRRAASSAEPPIERVAGGSQPTLNLSEASFVDYEKIRNAEELRSRAN
jgi:phage tail protein X